MTGKQPHDCDTGLLLDALEQDYQLTERWLGKRYAWVKRVLPAAKGRVGEQLFKDYAEHAGIVVLPRNNAGHDCRPNGIPVEVKLSTAYDTPADVTPYVQWLQLRPGGDYRDVALIAICPDHWHCWIVDKKTALEHAVGQHSGRNATETRILRVDDPDNPPEFLGPDMAKDPKLLAARLAAPPTS